MRNQKAVGQNLLQDGPYEVREALLESPCVLLRDDNRLRVEGRTIVAVDQRDLRFPLRTQASLPGLAQESETLDDAMGVENGCRAFWIAERYHQQTLARSVPPSVRLQIRVGGMSFISRS